LVCDKVVHDCYLLITQGGVPLGSGISPFESSLSATGMRRLTKSGGMSKDSLMPEIRSLRVSSRSFISGDARGALHRGRSARPARIRSGIHGMPATLTMKQQQFRALGLLRLRAIRHYATALRRSIPAPKRHGAAQSVVAQPGDKHECVIDSRKGGGPMTCKALRG
jgi:hypothetical protein